MSEWILRLIGSPWIAYPGVMIAAGVGAYQLYPRLEAKFLEGAFGKKDEIKKILDYLFINIEDEKLDRILLAVNIGPAALIFLLFWPNWMVSLIGAYAAWRFSSQLPYNYVKGLHEKRTKKLVAQLVDGLTIMANGIKAGLSVAQSIERVTDNLPAPIKQEFNLVLSQTRLGRTLEEALNEFAMRNPAPDIQMLVMAINILKETGGNLAETFETIVTVIRERQKVEQKIDAMTTQGRIQGMIISAAPLFVILMMYFSGFGMVDNLFNTTMGLVILTIVIGLIIIAGLVIKKIVTIRV